MRPKPRTMFQAACAKLGLAARAKPNSEPPVYKVSGVWLDAGQVIHLAFPAMQQIDAITRRWPLPSDRPLRLVKGGAGMTQNKSHAVMAQRHEPHDSLDFFPTPPWATRALIEHVLLAQGSRRDDLKRIMEASFAWDPACGQGHMVRPMAEYFAVAVGSDVHDYDCGYRVHDFLFPGDPLFGPDVIITNPPFRLAKQFIDRGLEVSTDGICVLVRTTFLEGVERFQTLFKDRPPAIVAPFVERVPMVKGRVDPKVSSATSYCWLVFTQNYPTLTPKLVWIPPCRKQLERPEDYLPVEELGGAA